MVTSLFHPIENICKIPRKKTSRNTKNSKRNFFVCYNPCIIMPNVTHKKNQEYKNIYH